jgi:hypothetical protein
MDRPLSTRRNPSGRVSPAYWTRSWPREAEPPGGHLVIRRQCVRPLAIPAQLPQCPGPPHKAHGTVRRAASRFEAGLGTRMAFPRRCRQATPCTEDQSIGFG